MTWRVEMTTDEVLQGMRDYRKSKSRKRSKGYKGSLSPALVAEIQEGVEAAREKRRQEAEERRNRVDVISDKANTKESDYKERRCRQDVDYAHYLIDAGIRTTIRKHGLQRPGAMRWEAIVGYTFNELKKHLEGRFYGGMAWDNYGQWHIHHKDAKVNYKSDISSVRRCWALSNLEPLWADDHAKAHEGDPVYNIMVTGN